MRIGFDCGSLNIDLVNSSKKTIYAVKQTFDELSLQGHDIYVFCSYDDNLAKYYKYKKKFMCL